MSNTVAYLLLRGLNCRNDSLFAVAQWIEHVVIFFAGSSSNPTPEYMKTIFSYFLFLTILYFLFLTNLFNVLAGTTPSLL